MIKEIGQFDGVVGRFEYPGLLHYRGSSNVSPVGCDKDLDLRIKTQAGTLGVCQEGKI